MITENQNDTIRYFVEKAILTSKIVFERDTYRLKRPVKIIIKKEVFDSIAKIYNPSYEKGGILLFRYKIIGACLETYDFIEVPNLAKNSINYVPNQNIFDTEVAKALNDGFLPMALHTHPTKIGLHSYDTRRQYFNLRASKSDVLIANKGITKTLEMPEAIFVKDERFKSGYDIAIYSGTIFPQTVSSLSNLQIGIGLAAGVGAAFNAIGRKLLLGLGTAFAFDFLRRPKYQYQTNGDLHITVNY